LTHFRPISLIGLHTSPESDLGPGSDLDWKEVTGEILKGMLESSDSYCCQTPKQVLSDPQKQSADVFLWLEDRPGCHSIQDYYKIRRSFPLSYQIVVTGPWSAGSGVAGSGRSGRTLDEAFHVSWIQFPYRWQNFRDTWNRKTSSIWDLPNTSPVKDRLAVLAKQETEYYVPKKDLSFLIQSEDSSYRSELGNMLQTIGHQAAQIQQGCHTRNSWKEESAGFFQERKTGGQIGIVIRSGHQSHTNTGAKTCLDPQAGSFPNIFAKDLEGNRSIELIDFAETQIQPSDWWKSWEARTNLFLGKPFHLIDLQTAISNLCF